MRVEIAQHAADGVLHQLAVGRLLQIVVAHGLERLAEARELVFGRGVRADGAIGEMRGGDGEADTAHRTQRQQEKPVHRPPKATLRWPAFQFAAEFAGAFAATLPCSSCKA